MSAETPPAELDRRNELVTLLVPAAERPQMARALLDAAGPDPMIVRTISRGFRVPRWVAEDADLVEPAGPAETETDGDGDLEQPGEGEQPAETEGEGEQPAETEAEGDGDAEGETTSNAAGRGRRK